jgi:hypothetical protein
MVPRIIKRKQNHKETKSQGSPCDSTINHKETKSQGSPCDSTINHKETISHGAHDISQCTMTIQFTPLNNYLSNCVITWSYTPSYTPIPPWVGNYFENHTVWKASTCVVQLYDFSNNWLFWFILILKIKKLLVLAFFRK